MLSPAAPCPQRRYMPGPHALYMYGRHLHPLPPCRPDSCASHPCLGPAVGSLPGRDVSRPPAASPGACAQYVRLWQYGHARHERNRGTSLLCPFIPTHSPVQPSCPTPHCCYSSAVNFVFWVASAAHERRCSTKCISSLHLQLQPPARGSGDRPLQLPPACAPVFTLALCLVFMFVFNTLNVWLTQTPLSPADDRQPRHDGAPR